MLDIKRLIKFSSINRNLIISGSSNKFFFGVCVLQNMIYFFVLVCVFHKRSLFLLCIRRFRKANFCTLLWALVTSALVQVIIISLRELGKRFFSSGRLNSKMREFTLNFLRAITILYTVYRCAKWFYLQQSAHNMICYFISSIIFFFLNC